MKVSAPKPFAFIIAENAAPSSVRTLTSRIQPAGKRRGQVPGLAHHLPGLQRGWLLAGPSAPAPRRVLSAGDIDSERPVRVTHGPVDAGPRCARDAQNQHRERKPLPGYAPATQDPANQVHTAAGCTTRVLRRHSRCRYRLWRHTARLYGSAKCRPGVTGRGRSASKLLFS